MKRALDLTLSSCAILLLLPLLCITALAIRCSDGGPVFFCQKRLGMGGKEFLMYKFRSMVVDAEALGPYYTQRNDMRITALGSFLRRSSVDELPQLLNVLKGEMSLVGPRPDIPDQKVLYDSIELEKRLSVRPGLTGLAQVELRSDDDHTSRLELDLEYIERRCITLDITIMVKTLRRLSGRGSF